MYFLCYNTTIILQYTAYCVYCIIYNKHFEKVIFIVMHIGEIVRMIKEKNKSHFYNSVIRFTVNFYRIRLITNYTVSFTVTIIIKYYTYCALDTLNRFVLKMYTFYV